MPRASGAITDKGSENAKHKNERRIYRKRNPLLATRERKQKMSKKEYKTKVIELNSDRKLINRVKKAGINTYHPNGMWNGYGYEQLPLVAEITSLSEMRRFNKIKKELKEERQREKEKINQVELTEEVIAKALYSVNKEAKRQRDIKNNAIDDAYGGGYHYSSVHSVLHTAKSRMNNLYDLKDSAISIAIKKYELTPIGYHEFGDGKRDMYELGGYQFHINENKSENCLGEITEEIGAERKRGIPPKKAIQILKKFISANSFK